MPVIVTLLYSARAAGGHLHQWDVMRRFLMDTAPRCQPASNDILVHVTGSFPSSRQPESDTVNEKGPDPATRRMCSNACSAYLSHAVLRRSVALESGTKLSGTGSRIAVLMVGTWRFGALLHSEPYICILLHLKTCILD
jgi:hypothetical protein